MDKMTKHLSKVFLMTSLFFTSCSYKADRTDIFKVGEAIHEAFVRKDTTILKQVFVHQLDSISDSQRETHKNIQEIFNKDIRLIKIDTSGFWWFKYVDIYYESKGVFYEVSGSYTKDSLNNYVIDNLHLTNITDECEKYNSEPYVPKSSISFKDISWTTDYYSKTFKSGKVRLQNDTESDIHYIKFRVILKNGEYSWNSETFFNQTIESYKPIYQGDIVTVEIPGLENYYTGFTIKRDNLSFDAQLIEVRPKPESEWCKKIEGFKEKK